MLRNAISVAWNARPLLNSCINTARLVSINKNYATIPRIINLSNPVNNLTCLLTNNKQILDISTNLIVPIRTVTKFSLKKGKRKTVKAAVKRFFRLHWGAWIRPKVGRQKKLWKKSAAQKRRLRQHVFCNATQATLLDKMVTKFWKKPKYYVDDPYESYHTREEFYITRKKPVDPR